MTDRVTLHRRDGDGWGAFVGGDVYRIFRLADGRWTAYIPGRPDSLFHRAKLAEVRDVLTERESAYRAGRPEVPEQDSGDPFAGLVE